MLNKISFFFLINLILSNSIHYHFSDVESMNNHKIGSECHKDSDCNSRMTNGWCRIHWFNNLCKRRRNMNESCDPDQDSEKQCQSGTCHSDIEKCKWYSH